MPDPVAPGRAPLWRSRRGAWGNTLVLVWLVACLASVPAQAVLPMPLWLVIHLFALGVVSTAIVLWSEHFLVTWGRTPGSRTGSLPGRLTALTLATGAVLLGVGAGVTTLAWVGTVVVAAVGGWHAVVLGCLARRARQIRFRHVGWYYPTAAVALVVVAVLAGLLVIGGGEPSRAWLTLAHIHGAVLGWIGLTVLGTLVTLWPTVLRTRIVAGAERAGRTAWWPLVAGLVIVTGGFLTGQRLVAVVGLVCYATGVGILLVPFSRTAFRRAPHDGASWMLALGVGWLSVTLAGDLAVLLTAVSPQNMLANSALLLPALLVGCLAQIVVGSLSSLLVPVLASGPRQRKQVAAVLARMWVPRLVLANVAVPLLAVPVVWVRAWGWALLAVSYGGFVLLALRAVAITRGRRDRRDGDEDRKQHGDIDEGHR